MKQIKTTLQNFVENSLTKAEKRNIIGSQPEKEKPKPPKPPYPEGNPLGSSTNGDGLINGSIPPPPPPPVITSNL